MKAKWIVFGVCALTLAGCPKKDEVVVSTPDGNVTVSGSGSDKTMTMTNEKGETVSVSAGNVDPSELGVEAYPGATTVANGTVGKIDTAEGTMITVMYSTPDSVEKVVEFYKGKLRDSKTMTTGEMGSASGKNGAGNDVQATVTVDKDKRLTMIHLTTIKKK